MNTPSQPAVGVAFFLLAKQYFPLWKGWPKSDDEIFLLAGVTQDEAYDARFEVLHRLYDLLCEPDELDLCDDDWDFATSELNEAGTRPGRNDRFSQFLALDALLEEKRPPEGWSLEQLAAASGIPLQAIQALLKSPKPKGRKRRPPEP